MDVYVLPTTERSLSPWASNAASNNSNTTSRLPSSCAASNFHSTRLSSVSPSQRQLEKPCIAQNRRLQLRNAGFRGALLQSRKLTPPLTKWRSLSGSSDQQLEKRDDDTSSIDRSWNSPGLTSSHTRRSSILEEINNSTQRRYHQSRRPPAASLFHDLPSPDPSTSTNDFPIYSPSKCTGQLGPPIDLDTFAYDDPDMPAESRKSSSRSSSFGGLDRSKGRPDLTKRNANLELCRYIEHLEEQLAASLDRVESLNSSTTNTQAAKFKGLNAEYKILKQELLEWETKFETRLTDELRKTIDKESDFRAKIRALERDIEIKENKIREQEWEIEMANQMLQSMEAVNATNRSLERRIDVLTELLAQSPTRRESSPGLNVAEPSPQADGVYHTPRPRSMFSKIPLSPVRKALFQPLSAPISNATPDPPVCFPADRSNVLSPQRCEDTDDAELMSLDSGVGDSCSPPSTRAPESQRLSMISHSSSNPSLWGTSFPLSPEAQGKCSNRHRRMRRFPPGSCTLKPLILPAASPHIPAGQIHRHSFSNDPISPFHLRPTSAHDCPSSLWIEHDALHALEGRSHGYQTFDEAINDASISMGLTPLETGLEGRSTIRSSSRLFFDDVNPSTLDESAAYDTQEQIEPLKQMTPCMLEKVFRQSNSSTHLETRTNHEIDSEINPIVIFDSCISKLHKTYSVACKSIMSFYCYVWDAVPNSGILVRRIIARAWHANYCRLGKLSWWVLGLFLGCQPRNQWLDNSRQCRITYHSNEGMTSTVSPRSPVSSFDSGTCYPASHVEGTPAKHTTTAPPNDLAVLTGNSPRFYTEKPYSPITTKRASKKHFEAWAKFSFALVLAIGLAVRDGPEALMDECLMRGYCITTGAETVSAKTNGDTCRPSEGLQLSETSLAPPHFSDYTSSGNQVCSGAESPPVHIPAFRPDIPPG
ncbi:conserved hypothetical protein [Histoplasma capsulatum var. duboisii H88]|uniref:SMC (Structural maintenance of chromosomes) domain-containing protein n=1 Tax=Ajellomyces capsulatus (strain H88) TaxID=544711 RepID=F0UKT4_AJEC8|nr:conserved hypothetical protein [Histoplasma capsulatum var. duboisii H88]QSS56665.1 SMC (structural maintenance of chromosomes) domain-containing protein [Histoplasma capsulatum var. duboisii H88]